MLRNRHIAAIATFPNRENVPYDAAVPRTFGPLSPDHNYPTRRSPCKQRDTILAMPLSRRGKRKRAVRQKLKGQWIHVKLEKRIVAALKRENQARGGRQKRQIIEEALTCYLRLKISPATNGNRALEVQLRPNGYNNYCRNYSRIVE